MTLLLWIAACLHHWQYKKVHQSVCKALGLRQQNAMKSKTALHCHPKDSLATAWTPKVLTGHGNALATACYPSLKVWAWKCVKPVSWWLVDCTDKAAFLTLKSLWTVKMCELLRGFASSLASQSQLLPLLTSKSSKSLKHPIDCLLSMCNHVLSCSQNKNGNQSLFTDR